MKLKNSFLSIIAMLVFGLMVTTTTAWADVQLTKETEDYHYSVTMPATGAVSFDIPNDAKTINVNGDRDGITNSRISFVAPEGKILQVVNNGWGGFEVEFDIKSGQNGTRLGESDSLFIYDGADVSSAELFKAARGTAIGILTSSGRNMTIRYKEADPKVGMYRPAACLYLTVRVLEADALYNIEIESDNNGHIAESPNPTATNTLVSLTAVPNEGYFLESVSVCGVSSNDCVLLDGGAWYSGNEFSFIMPGEDVRVYPTFSSNSKLATGLTIGMPAGRAIRASIPSGVESIFVTGDGMDNELTKPLILTAPEGYALRVESNHLVSFENADENPWAGFYAYDGDVEGAFNARADVMKSRVTASRTLTLFSTATGESQNRLTVRVVRRYPYTVTIQSSDYGSVVSNVNLATAGNEVVLTATPNNGYVLQGFYVQSDDGSIPVRGGFVSNKATFVMPYSDVSIMPEFRKITGDYIVDIERTYLYMPDTGSLVAEIPDGIQMFTVYSCEYGCDDAVLVLKAPEGRRFQVGPLAAMYETVPVRVFDGADTNAILLFSKTVDNYYGNTYVDGFYGRYVSSGQYVTIAFKKGDVDKFNLKMVVVDPNENHSISVGNIYGYNFWYHDDYYDRDEYMYSNCTSGCGSVSLAVESAKVNAQVSFSATPGENRVLNRVVVKDGYWGIAVSGGTWYTSNDATFTMPATDVTIEPYYARGWTARDGLTIETPYNEILEVDIPSEAESFTVNRGEVASASSMAPIKPLILRAPAGKLMQLEDNEGHPYYGDDFSAYIGAFEDPVAVDAPRMIGNTSSGEVLTLLEYTHVVKLVNASDFPHEISIVPRGDCRGNVTHNLTNLASVVSGTEVSMKVEPEEGCALNEVFIAVGSENDTTRVRITGGSWFTSEEFSFTMPFANIFVIVNYVEKTKMNAENGLYVNMPKVDLLTVSIPEGVQSFEVREPRTPYNGNVLTLTAPENLKLQISGLAYGESGDLLKIYDGANTGATELWSGKAGPVDEISSGNSLTLYLKGGLVFPQLTVKVVDPNVEYAINVFPYVTNGTVSSNVQKAKAGDVVTLTFTPENGYLLSDAFVAYGDNLYADLTGGTWYNNQAQFVMPASDVVVFAVFERPQEISIYAVIPEEGSLTASIPNGVSSLTVYSNYDYNDNFYYRNNSDGTLTLTAPEGFKLNVHDVNCATADDGDFLEIYDGVDKNAEKLKTFCRNNGSSDLLSSSGNSLTFRFKSNEQGNASYARLSVDVVNPWENLKVPTTGVIAMDIPEGVTFVRVQNEKDGDGHYYNNSDGSLTLTVPEGYAFYLDGSVATDYNEKEGKGDSLIIFDGADVNADPLIVMSGYHYAYDMYSSGRSITFLFRSDAYGVDEGIDIEMWIMKTSDYAAVDVYDFEGFKWARIDGSYAGTDAVNISEPVTVNRVEYNREFPTGVYSTMMLPFDVNTGNVSGLEAALYYNGIGTDKNGHQAIKMKVLWATNDWANANNITKTYLDTNLKANTPYLVQMSAKTFVVNGGVTIVPTAETAEPKNDWVFRGTWQYKKWGAFCSTEGQNCDPETGYAYGFAASSSDDNNISVGDFVKVGEGAWIRPMRAYLVHKDKLQTTQFVRANGSYVKRPSAVPEELPEFMSVIIDVDGDGDGKETTVIGQFNTRTGEFKMNYDRGTFDLKGRRVNSANKARGAYYGKKVLKK